MALRNNPFYLLKVSCSTGRREIVSAADEMSFVLDPEAVSNAQNELINLNKRLSSELCWFVNADEDTVERIRSNIENGEPIITDGLSSLSKLNATLYNFSLVEEADSYELGYSILDIDEQYSALNAEELTDIINQNREAAKLGTVKVQDVRAELGKKREEIRQLITEKLSILNQDTYIELVTMLAEKCIADSDYNDGIILSDVIDQYEVRMQSALEESTDEIEKHIERIKCLTSDKAVTCNIDSLIRRIKQWDILAQPLQLRSQASGMPHQNSEQLGTKLRNFALYLHNERLLTKDALTLINAMKSVFAELGELSDLLEADSRALNGLLKGQQEIDEIAAELRSLQGESESLKSLPNIAKVNNFIERIMKLDRQIKSMDLNIDTKAKVRESLCCMARETAIQLHNAKYQTAYALTIVKALADEFGDLPDLKNKLLQDVTTLNRQLTSGANRATPSNTSTRSSSSSDNVGCLIAVLVAMGVFVLIFFLLIIRGSLSKSSSSSNKSSYSSSKSPSSYSQSNSDPANDEPPAITVYYQVTLQKVGGTGGTSSVIVSDGGSMPPATAPSKSGYTFKGYYSSTNGNGTQYYDANMTSVHNWDKPGDGTLYACWEKIAEKKFTASVSSGEAVYVDIVSIFPEIGLYTQGNTYYSYFVCRCETSSGSTVWVYMSCFEYIGNFDSSASTSIYDEYAEKVTFSSAKRIHGTAKRAEAILSGLSSDTGTIVIDFSSLG